MGTMPLDTISRGVTGEVNKLGEKDVGMGLAAHQNVGQFMRKEITVEDVLVDDHGGAMFEDKNPTENQNESFTENTPTRKGRDIPRDVAAIFRGTSAIFPPRSAPMTSLKILQAFFYSGSRVLSFVPIYEATSYKQLR